MPKMARFHVDSRIAQVTTLHTCVSIIADRDKTWSESLTHDPTQTLLTW